MMTVQQLRDVLLSYPDDAIVVMSKDSEGNGYSPLFHAWQALYEPHSSYDGDVYSDRDISECHMDASKMTACIVLSPTN